MNNVITIASDERITDIYHHFKVFAGPGAGKTHWLVEHIKNILQNATTIHKTSKIACITYTTIGAEEIRHRLEGQQDKVEVSTIHSFLYANVVKPYLYLLNDGEDGISIDIKAMDGHFDNVASKWALRKWHKKANNWFIEDNTKVKKYLEGLQWEFDGHDIFLRPRPEHRQGLRIRHADLPLYKQVFWEQGIIHHEDVLYFAYIILRKYPIILSHLSAKYPFLFLDEFQDTNPIQVEIVKWFGNARSVIGVIGDPAQSIYGFQGASRKAFVNFELPNQTAYMIEDNRRSGTRIVELLNLLREADDVTQTPLRHNSAHEVYYLEQDGNIEQIIASFHELRRHLGMDSDYCILARKNETVKLLRNSNSADVWKFFEEADSSEREPFIHGILTGYKLAMDNREELAIKEIIRALRSNRNGMLRNPFKENQIINSLIKRSLAVDLLGYLVKELGDMADDVLTNFYESLRQFLELRNYGLKKITNGKIKQFADDTTLIALLDDLILPEEKTAEVRTIHKAKGAEFQSVLLYLADSNELKKLVKPDINSKNDDTRRLYVALSRAKDLLCIVCPPLNTQLRNKLRSMNLTPYITP